MTRGLWTAIALACALPCSGAEVFRDGFEDAKSPAWQHTWGPFAISAEQHHEGTHALKEILDDRYGYSVHYRDVAARPHTLYVFRAFVYIPAGQAKGLGARLSINTPNWKALAAAHTSETGKWVELSARFLNTAHRTLRFELMQDRERRGIGGTVMFWDSVLCTATSGADYMKQSKGRNPHVVRGLDVEPAGGLRITVSPGECTAARVAEAATLALEPPAVNAVRNEGTKLTADKPSGWAHGTRLSGCRSLPHGTTLPGCLVPGSVVVKLAPDCQPLVQGKDYLVDETWGMLGRIKGGAIGADTVVLVDYAYSHMRLDTVQVAADGTVSVRKGAGAKTCPHPAGADDGCLALANVFLNYNARELAAFDIFPIGPPLPAPTADELRAKAACVPKTRQTLAEGGKLLVGFWGDSVTCGGDASRPEARFPDAFIIALRQRYPKATIEFFNAGIGGSNSRGRLPNFPKDVIARKPDLVIIEFVNDMGFPPALMRQNYHSAIGQVRAIGGEVILVTPHFTMPSMMGFANVWGTDPRAACQALRDIAADKKVGLADAARRWQHLAAEGLPYTTLLFNGINHPDDRGHRLFVDELLHFF